MRARGAADRKRWTRDSTAFGECSQKNALARGRGAAYSSPRQAGSGSQPSAETATTRPPGRRSGRTEGEVRSVGDDAGHASEPIGQVRSGRRSLEVDEEEGTPGEQARLGRRARAAAGDGPLGRYCEPPRAQPRRELARDEAKAEGGRVAAEGRHVRRRGAPGHADGTRAGRESGERSHLASGVERSLASRAVPGGVERARREPGGAARTRGRAGAQALEGRKPRRAAATSGGETRSRANALARGGRLRGGRSGVDAGEPGLRDREDPGGRRSRRRKGASWRRGIQATGGDVGGR